jgi:hypothetical protein
VEAAGDGRGEDSADLETSALSFAQAVYSSPRVRTRPSAFADGVYGRQDQIPFHSPDQVRHHWFAEWKRRVGYGKAGDRDNVILVTAKKGKGEGKSACAFEIAAGTGSPIEPAEMEEHVSYRALRTLDVLSTLSRGEFVLYDEAGEGLLNTEFWSQETRTLTKAIAECRDIHATLVMCVPSVRMFNPGFMNALVDYWIQVRARGTAHVHPKPGERYTKARGLGWYPDREWNAFTWEKPEPTFWRAYTKFRKASRKAELQRFRSELEAAQSGFGKRPPPTTTCASCGRDLSRADALARHQASSCPGSSGRRSTA